MAILPEEESNIAIIKNIQKTLKVGGNAVVVIPSLESMIYSAWRMIDWYKKGKCKASENRCLGVAGFAGKKIDILQGLVSIDGVITKHYTQQR